MIYIFTGHYGSGKTETAVNFARMLKERGTKPVALVDLDIVNPFFRSADAKEMLEGMGIRVEVPLYANTNVDIPALTGNMGAVIEDGSYDVILDVGGDDLGAKAVGYYSESILKREHRTFFVVNRRRPFTETAEDAAGIFDEISASALVPVDGIINNTNLLDETTADTVLEGLPLVNRLAEIKNIPVCYHSAPEAVAEEVACKLKGLKGEAPVIPIKRSVRRLF